MLTLTLFDSNKLNTQILIPAIWNEFDLAELKSITKYLTGQLSKDKLIYDILEYRVGKYASNKNLPKHWVLSVDLNDWILELHPYIDTILSQNTLTNNPYLQIGKLFGPDHFLNDMLCGEFEAADQYFSLFVIEKDPEQLITAISILWRPKIDGKRIAAKDYEASETVKSFLRDTDSNILHLIYLWWSGCRQELELLFPKPFSSDETKTADDVEPDISVFTKAIHNGAGERNGSRSQIRWETLIKEFLFDLQLQLEYQEELEEKYKSNG